jgi:hypothetical protein
MARAAPMARSAADRHRSGLSKVSTCFDDQAEDEVRRIAKPYRFSLVDMAIVFATPSASAR